MNKQQEVTTTNIVDFGYRERDLLIELLKAWQDQGLPEDFYQDEVVPMMNRNSGNVFLTNSEFQVCMLNGDTLESFYSCPECGCEGFKEEMLNIDYSHECCLEYMKEMEG